MTYLRPLRVVATVSVLALVGVACGEEEEGSSLSGSQSASQASVGDSSSGSGGTTVAGTSMGTSEGPASTGDVSTGEPGTTTSSPTTGDPTTGSPGTTTTGDNTTGVGTTGNPVGCGDGAINGNEQCDGANLNGFTCEALGNAGGTLQCDPVTCTFDTQLCEVGGSGTGG